MPPGVTERPYGTAGHALGWENPWSPASALGVGVDDGHKPCLAAVLALPSVQLHAGDGATTVTASSVVAQGWGR